ncbi:hypothetical protein BCR33DRAFT_717622 [Rhizoclosmatium globosum]|uniref:Acyl-CoA dehydrogenase NM domain-like protein n=1 Tax=Rhizoclosmatium globosum TaxID=329046 RepID=A0A1Y2C8P1_9FUNG|nr:hypothetical protein BCR33DRAFT_717622 [Rhizoclosmatium globosum]|eukprot:ORY43403.1 hypothetical protein BCR33DRAFT_717622 [Rhizoclosmatium globosum]
MFVQTPPTQPPNAFLADRVLLAIIKRRAKEHSQDIHKDLVRFSDVLASPEVKENCREANTYLPQLRQYSSWGEHIDKIDTAHGWKAMKDLSAKEGLIATGYETKNYPQNPSLARVHQFAKLFLFSPVSALYTCPLAMTDGAALLLSLSDDPTTADVKREYLPRLLSRDPEKFICSGQWMTEKPGGSDVGNTETCAVPCPGTVDPNSFLIQGRKWFSSATDADITFLLAREGVATDNNTHTFQETSKGLSLFFAPIWLETPETLKVHRHARRSVQKLNGIQIVALKNKHGTKQLPTAELELNGMRARRMGPQFKGVKTVATMLNITRLHAAIGTIAGLRHVLFLAKDFANKRVAFGKLLRDQPLQARVLADLETVTAGLMHSCFYVVGLLGKSENGGNVEDGVMLRFLTPVMKAFVSKMSNAGISECMEALGGVGYIEETGVSTILRDQAVNMIWEGATNVMSLDVLRVLLETKGVAAFIFQRRMIELLNVKTGSQTLETLKRKLEAQLASFPDLCKSAMSNEVESRTLLFSMGYLIGGVLLVEEALFSNEETDVAIAQRWIHNCGAIGNFGVGGYDQKDVFTKDSDILVAFGSKL